MKSIDFFRKVFLFSTVLFVLGSCNDLGKERYEDPDWLGGSIIDTLKNNGNYTILLKLMERADYKEAIEKGLFTLFAANDSSYTAYFKSIGVESVDDLTDKQCNRLFTLNVLNTPRARQHLVYDYSQWHGGWQKEGSELGASLFRVPTRSKADDFIDSVRYFASFKGQNLKVLGQEKYVPLISTEFFKGFNGAEDGSDYTYFFPNTEWSGLQWYNANVIGDEVKCSNGYIYFIDRALPEIPSIEDHLRKNLNKFNLFYDILQRFATYTFSKYDDDKKTRLYAKSYRTISNLASEEGPPSQGGIMIKRVYFTVFAPTDDVLQNYLDNTFLKHFSSIDSIPEVSLSYLIQMCYKNSFDLPSKIQTSFVNNLGDNVPLNFNEDIAEGVMLSNGAFYTTRKFFPPKAFSSTVAPVFFDNKYTTYLQLINSATMISSFTSTDLEVTIFAPNNADLLEGGIRYNSDKLVLEALSADSIWTTLSPEGAKVIVGNHAKIDNLTGQQIDFSGEGFTKLNSNNYIYYNKNKIQAGGNQEAGNYATIVETSTGENGKFYALDNAILSPKNDPATFMENDDDLSEFLALMYEAGLADTIVDTNTGFEYANFSFLPEHLYWTVFAPTNQAVIAARNSGLIPTDPDSLKDFIRYHFVIDDVVFDDGVFNGEALTLKVDSSAVGKTFYSPVEIKNTKYNLSVVDNAGNTVKVNHSKANYLVKYGVLHKIDKVLLRKKD